MIGQYRPLPATTIDAILELTGSLHASQATLACGRASAGRFRTRAPRDTYCVPLTPQKPIAPFQKITARLIGCVESNVSSNNFKSSRVK
jgi:hypothetical protein